MITLSPGISYLDLRFQGVPRVIATGVLHGPGGVALIDPGPSSTLPTLKGELERAGIALADVTTLLLTHIHFDHAGASGTLVRENPRLRVYVHEKGAPHLINPEKLLASATRLYGDAMDRLWGGFWPVPEAVIVVLGGGERIEAAGCELDVMYTPGHASHHVSYITRDASVAFVGDTAGIKPLPEGYVLSPTPPPDVDLEAWHDSLARIERRRPDTLFLAHFGPSAPVGAHLAAVRDDLDLTGRMVKESLAREGTDQEREEWFADAMRRHLRGRLSDSDLQAYEVAGPLGLNWRGLARYWRKTSKSNSRV